MFFIRLSSWQIKYLHILQCFFQAKNDVNSLLCNVQVTWLCYDKGQDPGCHIPTFLFLRRSSNIKHNCQSQDSSEICDACRKWYSIFFPCTNLLLVIFAKKKNPQTNNVIFIICLWPTGVTFVLPFILFIYFAWEFCFCFEFLILLWEKKSVQGRKTACVLEYWSLPYTISLT